MPEFARVSVHGGHSGQFCSHAVDSLEEIVGRYIELDFRWICLTEHMPTKNPGLIPTEEAAAGLDTDALYARFSAYFSEAKRLARKYEGQIRILVGFETEAYSGYESEVDHLINQFHPDMIVGSVHHVQDVLFDASQAEYRRAVDLCGGIEPMYCHYFDRQLELVNRFEPAVVGHFDLVRIHDPDYPERWDTPGIRERAIRNLERFRDLGLILDLNVRALSKGASEPYVSSPWLEYAIQIGLAVAPGDDSHGTESVGAHLDQGVEQFLHLGGDADWSAPKVGRHNK